MRVSIASCHPAPAGSELGPAYMRNGHMSCSSAGSKTSSRLSQHQVGRQPRAVAVSWQIGLGCLLWAHPGGRRRSLQYSRPEWGTEAFKCLPVQARASLVRKHVFPPLPTGLPRGSEDAKDNTGLQTSRCDREPMAALSTCGTVFINFRSKLCQAWPRPWM